MKNRKLSARAVVSLMLSAILFCMPIGAFFANRTNTIEVHAEDTAEQKTESASDAENTVTPGNGREENSGTDTGEGKTENSTEGTTEDSSEETQPAAKCTCKEKCSQYAVDEDCEVCAKNYKECTYINPSVKITINTPSGWHNDTTKVIVKVEDTIVSGNFTVQTVKAKVGQNGSWTDITEDMYIEISENSTIYVQVTDQKGKTYEKNRYIKCFDFTKPTLNAAVSDGLLSIQAHDTDSGIKAIYVNGYEFTDHTNGALNIRLQQFDAGYQYFTISAMDNAGNTSEIYKTANPYYTDPENKDSNEKDPAQQLPVDASATKPSSATAQVTDHTKTDSNGNTVSQTGSGTTSSSTGTSAKQSPSTGDTSKDTDQSSDSQTSEKGREFYTIQTASEKVFYLVIDRDGEDEKVYFLTEVSENDLLNTTTDNSETLPKNSAALESAIPTKDSALSNNNADTTGEKKQGTESVEGSTEESTEDTSKPKEDTAKADGSGFTYILIGIAAVAVIGVVYVVKSKKKKENFIDEDEDEDELDEDYDYEDEDEAEQDSDEAFLNGGDDTESEDTGEKQIIPTEDGMKLITVLPDVVKSPKLTADWENALTLVAKGDMEREDFMADIETMVSDLIHTYHEVSDEQKKMFAQEQKVLGKCPNCGGEVVKGKYGAFCKNKCGMNVSRIMGVSLSDEQVESLLDGKKTLLKGLTSKAGKKYDAYIIPSGTEEYHYTKDGEEKSGVQFKFVMEFPNKKFTGKKK